MDLQRAQDGDRLLPLAKHRGAGRGPGGGPVISQTTRGEPLQADGIRKALQGGKTRHPLPGGNCLMSTAPVKNIATSSKFEPFGQPSHHPTNVWILMRLNKTFPFKYLLSILAVLVVLSALSVHAAPIRTVTATITRISDGDTVQAITPEGTKLKVRLYGIDAPETSKGAKPGEPFGNASRDYLASLISQRSVASSDPALQSVHSHFGTGCSGAAH